MAASYCVLTAIGADRVGIVDDIAGALLPAGCNIEESKMAVLGGEFAVIMLVSGSAEAVAEASRSLPALGGRLGLRIEVKQTREPRPPAAGRPYLLEAVSLDTPGIVHSITAILREQAINIESLETDTVAAPWTGAPMFRLKAHLIVEPSVSISRLRDRLLRLEQEHDLDITLGPVLEG